MDWIGEIDTAGDVVGAGVEKERSHCTADCDTDTDAAAGGSSTSGGESLHNDHSQQIQHDFVMAWAPSPILNFG